MKAQALRNRASGVALKGELHGAVRVFWHGERGREDSGSKKRSGFTLIELIVVVGVLSIIALAMLPTVAPSQPYKLDLAAVEIANALRHARGEALRTASPYGVHVEAGQGRFRVFRGDGAASPPTPLYDVTHPVSKRLYDFDLDGSAATEGVTVVTAATWSGSCTAPEFLGFDAAGTPRCGNPWAIVLEVGTLTLSYAGHTRNVKVDGETGRVTVQ